MRPSLLLSLLTAACTGAPPAAGGGSDTGDADVDPAHDEYVWEEPVDVDQHPFLEVTGTLAQSGVYQGLVELTDAADVLVIDFPGARVFAELAPGAAGAGTPVAIDPTVQAEVLSDEFGELDPGGEYTIVSFAVADETCPTTGITEAEVADRNEGPHTSLGGTCAWQSIAHSLVETLGVVRKDWPGIITDDGGIVTNDRTWDSRFMMTIGKATGWKSGDHRGRSQEEIDAGHTADWNTQWKMVQSASWETVDTTEDLDCEALRTWCEALDQHAHSPRNEDCIISLGGDEGSHAMPVHPVTFEEGEGGCFCLIGTVETGNPDALGALTGLPTDPPTQEWVISPDGIAVTDGANLGFWAGAKYTRAAFNCYDAVPVDETVTVDDPGDLGLIFAKE